MRNLLQSPAGSPGRGGLPHSTLWDLCGKRERKQNRSHYTAYCVCCTTVGIQPKGVTGKAEDMSLRVHLIKCQHASPNLKKWARDWKLLDEQSTSSH